MGFWHDIKNFGNRRIGAVFLLSFASGLPIALTASTLQAWYTMAGLSLLTIGMLSLVRQPYIYKFLWSPLLDRFVPFRFGRRRSWILLMQGCLAGGLLLMSFLNPSHAPKFLAFVALLVAFFSATQDIAIDAYRVDVLEKQERGIGAAVTTYGYRLAMIVTGALALIMAAEIGWHFTYMIMAGLMVIEMAVTLWSPNPQVEVRAPQSLRGAVVEPFKEFVNRKNAVLLLIFIVIYKISEAFALALNTTFLLRGIGFSLMELGSITKILGLTGSLLGALGGGLLLPRMGLYRSLMYFGFAQMAANLLFALLAVVGKSYALMSISVFADYFCGGLGSVAFVAFLMGLCNPKYTATQYALFSALMQIGQIVAGPEAAIMVDHIGWMQFYIWTFFMGVPSLLILWWLKRKIDFGAQHIAQPS